MVPGTPSPPTLNLRSERSNYRDSWQTSINGWSEYPKSLETGDSALITDLEFSFDNFFKDRSIVINHMDNWTNLIKDACESWCVGAEKHGKELEVARALVKEKNYEEALKTYVKVFEEGRDTSPLVGVRLSYVLGEMAEMGKVYEPARKTLLGYRESHEQIMRSGVFSTVSIQEWSSFCDYTDPNRKNEFYDLLKSEPTKNEDLLADLRRMIWLDLVSKKRYDEFSPADLAIKLKEIALISGQQLSPNSLLNRAMLEMAKDSPHKEFAIEQLLQQCGAIYECSIGLNKHSLAKKTFKLATYYQKTGRAYACFIIAASRAGDATGARRLVNDAKWCLPETEMKLVNAARERLNI